jgi:hypothetical protein
MTQLISEGIEMADLVAYISNITAKFINLHIIRHFIHRSSPESVYTFYFFEESI